MLNAKENQTVPLAVTHLNRKELALQVGVSPRTITKWMKNGRLPYLKAGRVVRFPVASVAEAFARVTVESRKGGVR